MRFKKIVGLIIAVTLLFPNVVYAANSTTVVNVTFSDVGSSYSWAKDAIDYFQRQGIVTGDGKGNFKPGDPVTREQFAKLLVLTFHKDLVNPSDSTFYDVDSSRWSYKYIETVKDYLTGYYPPDGKPLFDPSANSTREDIAIALVQMMGYTEDDLKDSNILAETFTDADDVDPNVAKLVAIAIEKKLITGFSDNTFRPNDPVTRAQAVTLLFRAMKGAVKTQGAALKLSVDVAAEVNTSIIYITGTTEAGAKVTINNENADVDEDGAFKAAFSLDNGEGEYTFNITASKGNKKTNLTKKVTYKIEGPTLKLDKIADVVNTNSITLTGTVTDPNDSDVEVTVNDNEVDLNWGGSWSYELQLKEGKNSIVIKAKNNSGKEVDITKEIDCELSVPTITITNCPETSDQETVTVSGNIKDTNDTRPELYINDKEVYVDYDGDWSKDVKLKEGLNTLIFKAVNNQDKTVTITKNIVFNVGGPTITLSSCPETSNVKTVTVSGNVKDVNDTRPKVYINDKEVYVNYDGSWSKNIDLNEGTNVLTIKAVNDLNKVSSITKNISFSIGAPTITLSNCPEASDVKTVTVSGKVTDINDSKPKLYINDKEVYVDYDGDWSRNIDLIEGTNALTIKAVNSLGKVSTVTKSVTFNVGAPIVNVQNCPETANTKTITISGTIKDANDSNPKLYINDKEVYVDYQGSWSKNIDLTEGENAVAIKTVNSLGKAAIIQKKVTLIILPPTIDITIPSVSNSSTINISGTVKDNIDDYNKLTLTVNGKVKSVSYNGSWSDTVNLSEGENTITIAAKNSNGKQAVINKVVSFTIMPPSITIDAPEQTNYPNVTLKGTVVDKMDSQPDFTINGENVDVSSYDGTFSKAIELKEGANSIVFTASSKTGKITTVTKNINLVVLPPILNVNVPETSTTSSIQISGNVSDILDDSVVVKVNDVQVSVNASGGWNYNLALAEGANNIKITATNKYGKVTSIEKVINYTK